MTGFSLGKAIFGVRIVDRTLRPIGLANALWRELQVFVVGTGMGLLLLGFIPIYVAYRRLRSSGETIWDRERYIVLHRPRGWLQTCINVGGGAIIVALIAALWIAVLKGIK
jgi:uncharacterized RDD family membrane protein YckC